MAETIVQTLKTEENCLGFYYEGAFQEKAPACTGSKKIYYTKYCETNTCESDCIFLDVWLKGQSLEGFTNDNQLAEIKRTIRAHKKAITAAKIDITETCIYDLLPDHLVHSLFSQNETLYRKVINSVSPPPTTISYTKPTFCALMLRTGL